MSIEFTCRLRCRFFPCNVRRLARFSFAGLEDRQFAFSCTIAKLNDCNVSSKFRSTVHAVIGIEPLELLQAQIPAHIAVRYGRHLYSSYSAIRPFDRSYIWTQMLLVPQWQVSKAFGAGSLNTLSCDVAVNHGWKCSLGRKTWQKHQ